MTGRFHVPCNRRFIQPISGTTSPSSDGSPSSKSSSSRDYLYNTDLNLFDVDSSEDDGDDDEAQFYAEEQENIPPPTSLYSRKSSASTMDVCSRNHQKYGAVAAQIHAKGVHTSLLMTVGVSPDGAYAFGGVARGSMELVVVDLQDLEKYHDARDASPASFDPNYDTPNLLDLLSVEKHADAKLRGFGACTKLVRKQKKARQTDPTYLLLTGKGIKNIHIWSFRPTAPEPWQCLYDTQTNGTTISLLHFRYTPRGTLHAISKSDDQRLRLWDLSLEQVDGGATRPKRPPFVDVASTESALAVGGPYSFGACHRMKDSNLTLVNLNQAALGKSHAFTSELAMPGQNGGNNGGRRSARGAARELKTIARVYGMPMDGSCALLEMSDGSVVQFIQQDDQVPTLEATDRFALKGLDESSRTMTLGRLGREGWVVAALAVASLNSHQGMITVQGIRTSEKEQEVSPSKASAHSPRETLKASKKTDPLPSTKQQVTPAFSRLAVARRSSIVTPSSSKAATVKSTRSSPETTLPNVAVEAAVSPEPHRPQTPPPRVVSKKKKLVVGGAMDKFVDKRRKKPVDSSATTSIAAPSARSKPASSALGAANKKRFVISVQVHADKKRTLARTNVETAQPVKLRVATNQKGSVRSGPASTAKTLCLRQQQTEPKVKTSTSKKVATKETTKSGQKRSFGKSDATRGAAKRTRTPAGSSSQGNFGKKSQGSQRSTNSGIPSPSKSTSSAVAELRLRQAEERRLLALEHRAAHELLRKNVLSTRCLGALCDYEENVLEDLLYRQRMESVCLAARHVVEGNNPSHPPPCLAVSFPFPHIFDQARSALRGPNHSSSADTEQSMIV